MLAQLEDRQSHGYEIAQQIAARSGGRRHLSRRVALSRALPSRTARPDLRPLGRKSRAAAAPLLPAHRRRAQGARRAAQELEHVHAGRAAGGGGVTMRDFKAFVREQVSPLCAAAGTRAKIVEEWAAQLEDVYDALRRRRPRRRRGVERVAASSAGVDTPSADELLDAEPVITGWRITQRAAGRRTGSAGSCRGIRESADLGTRRRSARRRSGCSSRTAASAPR